MRRLAFSCLLACVMSQCSLFTDFTGLSGDAGGGVAGGPGGGAGGGGAAGGGAGGGGASEACSDELCLVSRHRLHEGPTALYVASPNDVWFVGVEGMLLKWNGASLNAEVSPTPYLLFAVAGTGPSDVWTAGLTQPDVFHYDGGSWASTPFSGGQISALAARSRTEVYAVAEDQLYLFDGGQWSSILQSPTSSMYFSDVAVSARGTVFASFNESTMPHAPTVARLELDGGRVDEALPVSQEVRVLECGPGDSVWAAGERGTVLRRAAGVWSVLTIPFANEQLRNYLGIWAPSDDDAWFVGTGGALLHWRADAGYTTHGIIVDGGDDITWLDVGGAGEDLWLAGRTGQRTSGLYDAGIAARFRLRR